MAKNQIGPNYAGIEIIISEFVSPGKVYNMGGRCLIMAPELAEAITNWIPPQTRWSYAWIKWRIKLWWAKLVLEVRKCAVEADWLLKEEAPIPPVSDCPELFNLPDMWYKRLLLKDLQGYKVNRPKFGRNWFYPTA